MKTPSSPEIHSQGYKGWSRRCFWMEPAPLEDCPPRCWGRRRALASPTAAGRRPRTRTCRRSPPPTPAWRASTWTGTPSSLFGVSANLEIIGLRQFLSQSNIIFGTPTSLLSPSKHPTSAVLRKFFSKELTTGWFHEYLIGCLSNSWRSLKVRHKSIKKSKTIELGQSLVRPQIKKQIALRIWAHKSWVV